ncbi:MAG: aminodeoxychorismate lyase [Lachnospiraceae bacterium]|nr:aminodeoxychorismate lyase [Lachnospiraceae bacterium]
MRNRDGSSAAAVIGSIAGRVIVSAVMVLVIFVAVRYSFTFGKAVFYQAPVEKAPGRDIEIEVTEGMGNKAVAEALYDAKAIRNDTAFSVMERVYKAKLFPGIYTVNTSSTSKEILLSLMEQSAVLKEEADSVTVDEDAGIVDAGGEADHEQDK